MTGFGRASRVGANFRVTAEIRSVNSRFLELRPKLPRGLQAIEPSLRSLLQAGLQRGVVDIAILVQPTEQQVGSGLNEGLAHAYAGLARRLATELDLPQGVTALSLLKLPGVLGAEDSATLADDPELPALALGCAEEALAQLIEMRKAEGKKLASVLKRELAEIAGHRDWIEGRRGELNERQAQRLRARLETWMSQARPGGDDARFYQEVAYYLDRSDVTEELDRLASHLKQCEAALGQSDGKSVGKRVEFLAQEIGREVNTIGAKSDQREVTGRVVEMKLVLEKIREQVQNLE